LLDSLLQEIPNMMTIMGKPLCRRTASCARTLLTCKHISSTLAVSRHFSYTDFYTKVSSLPAVHFIQDNLVLFHDATGLPWWGTFILSTVGLRAVISLPAQITSQKVACKRQLLNKEMENTLIPSLKKATDAHVKINGWSEQQAKKSFARVAREIYSQKVIEYNCHMSKLFLPLYIQIPFWICMSMGIRNLVERASQSNLSISTDNERLFQLCTEGALWFPDLTIPDAWFVLPFVVGSSFALNVFIGSLRIKPEMNEKLIQRSKAITYVLYSFCALLIPIASIQPSALTLYWSTSGVFSIMINLLLLSPKFRTLVRIPKTDLDSKSPYRDIKTNILSKLVKTK